MIDTTRYSFAGSLAATVRFWLWSTSLDLADMGETNLTFVLWIC
jgi:hypothetical protein